MADLLATYSGKLAKAAACAAAAKVWKGEGEATFDGVFFADTEPPQWPGKGSGIPWEDLADGANITRLIAFRFSGMNVVKVKMIGKKTEKSGQPTIMWELGRIQMFHGNGNGGFTHFLTLPPKAISI